ncbi:hypothetical protein TPHA_0E03350 [Tetrapisispora phaffii CBS 4417]|uniref:Amino acid permease/ SLC12A domain-containing protein n=1 Tax=Tetrapisispora phaffii (strain ATCC 24235 / CBS 4417 / NBRC 1672 / NRRL Y-8282 / UCD 70-5) TaxID=1071381 RepID=G8BU47_TETPH|nr:hypothetical protein TPHA_0E03350 [Tetrapisispora phaffii CBS 4417]CCE63425.1 hypothetical protein TPHA_0E03350 [Tetrapisispora phaffii CBS 4417]
MPEYRLVPDSIRENFNNFHPNELFENLHDIVLEGEVNADESDLSSSPEVNDALYEQQLDKSLLSKSSIVGLGFGLMSPVLGMCTSMSIGLKDGGPLTILIGFMVSGIFTWFCSLSLGEVVSKYPNELHISSAMLSSYLTDNTLDSKLRYIASWYTGWLMLIGNWTMSTSITFAGAQLTISLLLLMKSDLISETHLILFTVIVFYLVVTIVGFINLKFSRFIETINKICVIWIFYAIIFIDVLLLVFQAGKFRSLKYALFHFDNSLSGYTSAFLSFIIGFQQSNFTLQGFSMLPALADEVKRPERDIPRGMSTAVLLSTFSGVVFLLPIMLILPDLDNIFNNKNSNLLPIVSIFTQSTHSKFVSVFLVFCILGNLLFSGIGSITTSSRAVYSFSRDHALPYHELWTFVDSDSVSKVPKYSIWLSMGVSYTLGLLALFSTAAFNAFVGAAVLCLCTATVIPLILVLISGRRSIRNAPVKMKYKLGWIVNILSVAWLLLAMVSVCFPPQIPVTFSTMNYALMVYIFCLIIITVLYFQWGKNNFVLPHPMKTSLTSNPSTYAMSKSLVDLSRETDMEEFNSTNKSSTEENKYNNEPDAFQDLGRNPFDDENNIELQYTTANHHHEEKDFTKKHHSPLSSLLKTSEIDLSER